jgi:uncharacterized membrane protein YkvA (DUF1232 family)
MSTFMERWKAWARRLEIEEYALFLAYKDPRTPWYAKIFTAMLVGYALSPIDLIPDFIPVIGYLDDLVIVPLGTLVAIKMIPAQVMEESRAKSKQMIAQGKPINKMAAAVIVVIWVGLAVVAGSVIYRILVR